MTDAVRPDVRAPGRVAQLDGLRGAAALVVFLGHTLLVSPRLTPPFRLGAGAPVSGSAAWLTYTPLHLLWEGQEAVLVFFVLSGFVLPLPLLHARWEQWRAYYPSRLVRLYLPVWAAVAVAIVLSTAVARNRAGLSWWVGSHDQPVTAGYVLPDLVLLRGTNSLDSPLWSLQWEVWFSLLLPLYVVGARRTRAVWPVALVGLLAVSAFGVHVQQPALTYLPVFGLGVVLAVNRDAVARRVAGLPTAAWTAVTVLALALLNARWTPVGLPRSTVLPVVGAALLVAVVVWWPAAGQVFRARWLQALGLLSFSFYLTHEPIVVAVARLLHTTNPLVVFVIALPMSLLVATVFYRVVEHPAHRLSVRVRRTLSARRRTAELQVS